MKIRGIEAKLLERDVVVQNIERFLELERVWVSLGETPWTVEQFLQERRDKWRLSSYADYRNLIIGYTVASRTKPEEVYLHKILVDPLNQGMGAGSLLFADLVRKVRIDEVPYLRFKSRVDNARANSLYASYGCKIIGQEVSPDGIDRYVMELDLRGVDNG